MGYDIEKLRSAITDKECRTQILQEVGYHHQLDHYLNDYWKNELYFLNYNF